MTDDVATTPPFGVQPNEDGTWRVRDAYRHVLSVEPSKEIAVARAKALTAKPGKVRVYSVVGQVELTIDVLEESQDLRPSATRSTETQSSRSPAPQVISARDSGEKSQRGALIEQRKQAAADAAKTALTAANLVSPPLTQLLANLRIAAIVGTPVTLTIGGFVVYKSSR